MQASSQRKIGIILSYVSQIVSVLTGILYTPVMLRILGQNEYGVYQLATSIISYLSLLSLGFGSSYMRFYSRYKVNNEEQEIRKLNGMFMLIFVFFSIVCLACGAIIIAKAEFFLGDGLTKHEVEKAKQLMVIMIISMAVSFPSSAIDCTITAKEQFVFQRIVALAYSILNPFLALPLLLLGYGSLGMVCVVLVLTITKLCVNLYYSVKQLNTRFNFSGFDIKLLKEMSGFTFFIFLNMIFNQINHTVDKFLLGRYMSSAAVAVYAVADNLYLMYQQMSTAISGVFIPKINNMVASSDNNFELSKLMLKVGRIQFILVALIISGFCFFGKKFIFFWGGAGYDDSYRICLMLMIAASVSLIQNLGIEIQRAKNKHQVRSVVYVTIAVANVFVSIPCIKVMGTAGAALGTAITLILGTWLFMNYYYHARLKIDMIMFWKGIASFIPALILPIIVGLFISKIVVFNSLITWFVGVVFYSTVYIISMWKFGMNQDEKEIFSRVLNKIRSFLYNTNIGNSKKEG